MFAVGQIAAIEISIIEQDGQTLEHDAAGPVVKDLELLNGSTNRGRVMISSGMESDRDPGGKC